LRGWFKFTHERERMRETTSGSLETRRVQQGTITHSGTASVGHYQAYVRSCRSSAFVHIICPWGPVRHTKWAPLKKSMAAINYLGTVKSRGLRWVYDGFTMCLGWVYDGFTLGLRLRLPLSWSLGYKSAR